MKVGSLCSKIKSNLFYTQFEKNISFISIQVLIEEICKVSIYLQFSYTNLTKSMQVSKLQNQDHNYNFQSLQDIRSKYEKSLHKCIQQKSKNDHLMSLHNQLSRKNNQLFEKVCKKLNKMSKEIETETIELSGQRIFHRRNDAEDQFEQKLNKQEYFFKIPNINIHIGNIGTPNAISEVEKRIQNEMNEDRYQLENEITKLKILIKLSQLNNQDVQSQNSKSQKSKH